MHAKSGAKRGAAPSGPGGALAMAWLAVALAHAVVLATKLANAPSLPWRQLQPLAWFTAATLLCWLWLRLSDCRGDTHLVAMALFLAGMGMAIQFRMGVFAGAGGKGVTLALPLGVGAMLVVLALARGGRYRLLPAVGWVCYLAAVAMLAAMLIFGRQYRGGVYLPGHLNPSEVVKPLLVIFLASFLSGRKADFSETQIGLPMPPARTLWLFAALWAVPVGLVLLMRDLGLLVLLNAVLTIMLYAVARKAGYLVAGGVGVVLLGMLAGWISAHARARFDVWLDPFADATGKGWQILQALSAMYAGGLWGAGIGAGTPQVVPIVASDFVYAALAEELGLIACALLLMVYGAMFLRGWRIASQAKGPFGVLLGVGLTSTLAVQTLLNVAGVTKALPMTGIPLPFISQGGSSLATSLAMIGLLVAMSEGKGGK
ncbi:MAG: FtsW/RodA/SpoVE family cell cycle protein [Kiritimatiellae bacterium]|nr:FtsW/RodA/SpoVE family cell cycle protein [Kiritimatiellia bacterium]